MKIESKRSGHLVPVEKGYMAFVPRPLPPEDGLLIDGRILTALSEADLGLGRLDGVSGFLPEPDLFIMMYMKKEAVWSSQIEGTQASLMDVLEFEGEALRPDAPRDVGEVVNYIGALQRGLLRIKEGKDIDLDMIRELHQCLMKDSRGGTMSPGDFRKVQNWIGPPGCGLSEAIFIPPPPVEMMRSLEELENFILHDRNLPPLIKAALVHSQFESIHPFLDGNGRMGRLLILLVLVKEGHLKNPLLYLSYFFRKYRSEYYEYLQMVREHGEFEDWISFFLKGVKEVSDEALNRSKKILSLIKNNSEIVINELGRNGPRGTKLLDAMLRRPVLDVKGIKEITELSFQNANKLVSQLEEIGILVEITGNKRNRIFEYKEYLDILEG